MSKKITRLRGTWTLAVLEFVDGVPDGWTEPERCGELLGRVHRILRHETAAGRLLDYYAAEATGPALADAVAAIREFDRDVGLSHGVLYGDPAPEILRSSGELALIDWGTPSWGPLLHDLVCWQRFDAADRVLAGYRAHVPITDAELAATDLFRALHKAIDAEWTPA